VTLKRYKIGERDKLIPISEDNVRESEQELSQRVEIVERGAVACYESESNKGKNGAQPPAAKVKTALREAFRPLAPKDLSPEAREKWLDIATRG
jgi:hypothetical protein